MVEESRRQVVRNRTYPTEEEGDLKGDRTRLFGTRIEAE